MNLLSNEELEASAVVANCNMNRERVLCGGNGYDRDLRFDPLEFVSDVAATEGTASWLDLCCGTGKALIEAGNLVQQRELSVSIVGVDLVGMFDSHACPGLQLIEASLSTWQPEQKFDLITCVHGLHYVGDKLDLIVRALSWLDVGGRFAANLDPDNLKLDGKSALPLMDAMRRQGLSWSSRNKVLRSDGIRELNLPVTYVGADDQAGPNYTGQSAVDSHYLLSSETC